MKLESAYNPNITNVFDFLNTIGFDYNTYVNDNASSPEPMGKLFSTVHQIHGIDELHKFLDDNAEYINKTNLDVKHCYAVLTDTDYDKNETTSTHLSTIYSGTTSLPVETSSDNKEQVNHPSHYQGNGIECIDAMQAAFGVDDVSSFCKLNAFKYIWRSNSKGKCIEDIKKSIWYLNKFIELNQPQK